PDDVRQTHRRALREMPELMRQHSRKFSHVQAGGQWQPDREHQIFAPETSAQTGRGVHLAIHIDAARRRRADQAADFLNECKQQLLLRWVERTRIRDRGFCREEGLYNKEDEYPARHGWPKVEYQPQKH